MNKKFRIAVTIVCLVSVALYVTSLIYRVPNEDEAVIADHANSILKNGYVKTTLYAGYGYGWDVQQFHYHKLFVGLGSLSIKIFGLNIYVLKTISLVSFLLLLYVIYTYLRRRTTNYADHFFIVFTLLFTHNLIYDYSFMYRPELLVALLGFSSFYFLTKYLDERKNKFALLGGLFAGLSALTHLNGVTFCVAGFALLLFRRQYKGVIMYSLIGGVTALLYLYDVHNIDALKTLILQLKTDPNVVDKLPILMNLLGEHQRFFWGPQDVAFSLLFFFSLFLYLRYSEKKDKNLLYYLLFLVVAVATLSHGKTTKYFIYYLPFMAIMISDVAVLNNLRKGLKRSLMVIASMFIGIHLFFDAQLIGERIDIKKHNEEITALLPEKNVKISAPAVFVFNQMDNYDVRAEIAFDHHYYAQHSNEERSTENYFKFARENGDKYIIIDQVTSRREFVLNVFKMNPEVGAALYDYTLIKKEKGCLVLQRQN